MQQGRTPLHNFHYHLQRCHFRCCCWKLRKVCWPLPLWWCWENTEQIRSKTVLEDIRTATWGCSASCSFVSVPKAPWARGPWCSSGRRHWPATFSTWPSSRFSDRNCIFWHWLSMMQYKLGDKKTRFGRCFPARAPPSDILYYKIPPHPHSSKYYNKSLCLFKTSLNLALIFCGIAEE